jgi:hypothetical protein
VVVSADLMKLAPEIYRRAKSGAKSDEDPLSRMTDYPGGTRIPFRNLRQLEADPASIGEELHNGYVLSYAPDRADAGIIGFGLRRRGGCRMCARGPEITSPANRCTLVLYFRKWFLRRHVKLFHS